MQVSCILLIRWLYYWCVCVCHCLCNAMQMCVCKYANIQYVCMCMCPGIGVISLICISISIFLLFKSNHNVDFSDYSWVQVSMGFFNIVSITYFKDKDQHMPVSPKMLWDRKCGLKKEMLLMLILFLFAFFLVSKEICDIKIWQFKNKQIKWKTDMIIYENVYMRWSQAFK